MVAVVMTGGWAVEAGQRVTASCTVSIMDVTGRTMVVTASNGDLWTVSVPDSARIADTRGQKLGFSEIAAGETMDLVCEKNGEEYVARSMTVAKRATRSAPPPAVIIKKPDAAKKPPAKGKGANKKKK